MQLKTKEAKQDILNKWKSMGFLKLNTYNRIKNGGNTEREKVY